MKFLTATQTESTANSDVQQNQVCHPETSYWNSTLQIANKFGKVLTLSMLPIIAPASAHPFLNCQRRMRTGTEGRSESTSDQSANATNKDNTDLSDLSRLEKPTLTLQIFPAHRQDLTDLS